MADTTTPTFALVLIQIGGSRDTWGKKLNDNMTAIDAAMKAIRDSIPNVAGLLPITGGALTGALTRKDEGVFPHFAAPGMTSGKVYLAPASGADPRQGPGDVWLAY